MSTGTAHPFSVCFIYRNRRSGRWRNLGRNADPGPSVAMVCEYLKTTLTLELRSIPVRPFIPDARSPDV